ncbi:MAG: hypothetical protein ACPGUV_08100, partial [Polyangiales bacterium]
MSTHGLHIPPPRVGPYATEPRKSFNTAGPCLADRHYMLPASQRLTQLGDLIAEGAYFVIHAPRQTGKTTLLRHFAQQLNTS